MKGTASGADRVTVSRAGAGIGEERAGQHERRAIARGDGTLQMEIMIWKAPRVRERSDHYWFKPGRRLRWGSLRSFDFQQWGIHPIASRRQLE